MSVDRFFTRLNPLIAGLLRSRLHFLLSKGLMLITVTGRRSGRRYSFPVGYQRDRDGITVMVSDARRKQWWRNYRKVGPVALRVQGRDLRGQACVIPSGTPEFDRAARKTLQRMPWLARVFGLDDYDRREGLRPEQLKRLSEEIAAVRITFDA